MSYGVLVQEKVAALNIDSLNRSAVSASPIENGMVMNLLSKATAASLSTSGSEVWQATYPVTGSLINLWMAYEPEVVLTSSGNSYYKGIDPDPRNFVTPAGYVFSVYKPQLGDMILLTDDALTGSVSTGNFVVAADADYQLTWAAANGAGLTYRYLGVSYISIADGSIGTQRVTARKFECVGI